jgi:hypothetical protein
VTAVLELAPVAALGAGRRRVSWPAALPWVLVAIALAGVLHWTHTPVRDVNAYTIYWVVGIVVPGTLTHRAMRGSRGNLPEDLGFGAAMGLLLELLAWALAAAVGAQSLLRWWPVLVIVPFLAVPALRRHWRIAEPRPLPVLWSALTATVVLLGIGWAAFTFRDLPLPPANTGYYQDLLYHLALVQEMTRSMPFEVPQLAGDTLRYHYLSDAHMAAASMITGVSPATVLLRLWIVPIAATSAVVVAALAREITGKWWAGPLAAGVAVAGLPLTLGAPIGPFVAGAIVLVSPSQTYAVPFVVLLVAIAVDVLRGRRLGWTWVVVPVLAVACAGAKSSALPPLLVGVLLAGVLLWWRAPAAPDPSGRQSALAALDPSGRPSAPVGRRRVPWPVLGLAAAIVAAMAVGFRIFAGGGAGTLALQPFSALTWMEPYQRILGVEDGVAPTGLLLPGVEHATAAGKLFITGLVVWWLLMQAPRLLGLALLPATSKRADPVSWLLGGSTLAGLGAAWAFWHPSASQLYFFAGVVPFGALLTVCLLADLVRSWRAPVLGLVAGVLWIYVAPATRRPVQMSFAGWARALAEPVLWSVLALVVLLALAAAVGYLRKRRIPWPALPVVALAALLGASIGTGVARTTDALAKPARTAGLASRLITADEMRAALWLDAHVPNDDLIATNVHCQPIRTTPDCDARGFWVAGLGGHRTLIESWGYTDEAVQANGGNGRKYNFQPAPDPQTYALNEAAFTSPTAAGLHRLRTDFQVRWLFADTRAGTVAPTLPTLATPVFTAGPVTIYAL